MREARKKRTNLTITILLNVPFPEILWLQSRATATLEVSTIAMAHLYLKDVSERGAGLHVGAAEVGELPLVEVDDGPLEVVGAVVEEEQHGGAHELRAELGERARVDRLEEDLQALDRLVHVRAERHHPQPDDQRCSQGIRRIVAAAPQSMNDMMEA